MGNGCGDPKCSVSTGINDGLTFGSGNLDFNGFWEHPCNTCARWHEENYPQDGKCWPFAMPTRVQMLEAVGHMLYDAKEDVSKLSTLLKSLMDTLRDLHHSKYDPKFHINSASIEMNAGYLLSQVQEELAKVKLPKE
jgi:hypothetical protein